MSEMYFNLDARETRAMWVILKVYTIVILCMIVVLSVFFQKPGQTYTCHLDNIHIVAIYGAIDNMLIIT